MYVHVFPPCSDTACYSGTLVLSGCRTTTATAKKVKQRPSSLYVAVRFYDVLSVVLSVCLCACGDATPVTQIETEDQREEKLRNVCRGCKTPSFAVSCARPLRLDAVLFRKHLRLIAIDGVRCRCECLALRSLAPCTPPRTPAFVWPPLSQCPSLAAPSV